VTAKSAPITLVDRAASLTAAAERIRARNVADADASAVNDALTAFTKCLTALRPPLAQARALCQHGVTVATPTNGSSIASALRDLAERIDTNPVSVRQRAGEIAQLDAYVDELQTVVDETLRTRLSNARGGAQAGIVQLLRNIALDAAADNLETALAKLDAFEEQLPETVSDLRTLDSAAESIHETFAELEKPEYDLLIKFVRRTYQGPQPTLADVDPALFGQLQSSGAATNFVVRLRDR
jgi:hypothetical protein